MPDKASLAGGLIAAVRLSDRTSVPGMMNPLTKKRVWKTPCNNVECGMLNFELIGGNFYFVYAQSFILLLKLFSKKYAK